ncbi:microfibril-associated glycoprotein 4-like isoform X1 [Salarias fasciatus]|uniref:microfibril-associated glycoprotein 4-like isoform X1 n=1 Tax=Salarias fasciatus TaxID=181472 RepID=UPI001176826C|nr:microfibril-associated glycoprotein 4-like isoform X1 [Salarias fasciatus]
MRQPSLHLLLLLLPPLLTSSCPPPPPPPLHVDCKEIHDADVSLPSGVYTIYPTASGVQVFCEMKDFDGGWTVFQRRMDGSVNFYRPWDLYKEGFGNAEGEYWLGLEHLFNLTNGKDYQLVVDMEDFEGNRSHAYYSVFSVDSESDGYRLNVSGFVGKEKDSLKRHNGQKFSTFDRDQDNSEESCARKFMGAFWYNNCLHANPNGLYLWGSHDTLFAGGMEWYHWKGFNYSLKGIRMMIRPKQ